MKAVEKQQNKLGHEFQDTSVRSQEEAKPSEKT